MSNQEQPTPEIFAHGACWVRADFHMHTRADREFVYTENPNQFVGDFVAGLKKSGIRVGVITNHNKLDSEEFKALRKAARKEDIFLLPGVELSVKDGHNGIHTLIVFSPEWVQNQENKNYIQSFLDVTFSAKANYENENGRSNHDMNDTVRELNKFERDYFLICAHVEAKSGLWKELDGGRREELAKYEPFRERCLGFQKVRTHDLRELVKQQMAGCYPAEVEGCDCKSIDEIGKGEPSFLKIGAFTFEAVKFALLDHTNRVKAKEPPSPEHSYISEVSFEGANLDGTRLCLSPELNTFIGIRGSGKSSIIETIRYALGIELPENNRKDENEYKRGSVQTALGSGGKVTLWAVNRHGQEYEVRRIYGEQPDVFVGGVIKPGINIRETILHKPIYFGQKDLSSTGQGFENELVEKLVGDSLQDNRFTIKYHGKQLTNHSLGQRASALILFVLSQRDNDVVIIDLPEDDLDNQTIYEDVIKLVRKLKPETQFIFATHNANIPVLGDAEQVVACKYTDDGIQTQIGSIDCPSLQDSIVRIMEGGEEAFNERKRIYQVWKHQNS